jgi:hypothetical protein
MSEYKRDYKTVGVFVKDDNDILLRSFPSELNRGYNAYDLEISNRLK